MKLVISAVVVSSFYTNCYICYNDETKEGFLVDPGDNAGRIDAKVKELGVNITLIVLTHGHVDHIGAAQQLKDLYGVDILAYETEKKVLEDAGLNLSEMFFNEGMTLHADRYVKDGDNIELAGFSAKVIHTPGHTPGSMCLYFEAEKILLSGDTIFRESLGRTDFPGGNTRNIAASICNKLLCLPDDVVIYPGHNEQTDMAHEKKYNPVAIYAKWME